jgi:competence protein ComEC
LLLRALTVPRKLSAVLCILVVWIYSIMAGGRPAVERAAFVASVYYAAILFERIPDLLSALALCAIVTLWANPALIVDAGFQMTFITVLGILALMEPLSSGVDSLFARYGNEWKVRQFKRLVEIELLSIAAQASSAPLTAYYYNLVAIGAVPANMLAVPIMVLLLPASLISVLIGAIYLPAGQLTGRFLVAPLLHGVVWVVQGVSSNSAATVSVAQPSIFEIVVYYSVLIGGSLAATSYTRSLGVGDLPGGADRSVDTDLGSTPRVLVQGAAAGERG